MSAPIGILTVLAPLGSGLVAGILFAFSTFLMAAFARLPAAQGIAAMQSINVTILNGWFLGLFFGTAALGVVLGAVALRGGPGWPWFVAGGLLYVAGVIVVTMAANVPLNNALASVAPDSAEGAQVWARYLDRWVLWNHVRTAASLAAAMSFMLAWRA
jgi:uncharacterized membrane protein